MRIKEVLIEEILCKIVKKLGLEICKGILMYIESVVQIILLVELGKIKLDMFNIIFVEIDVIISEMVVKIFCIIYGVIILVIIFFIIIFCLVDVNLEEWRSQVVDEVYFNILKKRDFLRDLILDNFINFCVKIRDDFKFIIGELEKF